MRFDKPPAGSWTASLGLDTGLVDYEDSISPAHFELEREAIFRRTWLNIGRVEELPNKGSYITRELEVCNTSLLIARGTDGKIRAFHNMCSHRGNQLVWDGTPLRETRGTTRRFVCKYHGWMYSLEGDLLDERYPTEFFELDKCKLGLSTVHCEELAGFIFVNLAEQPAESLRDYLGDMADALEGYPFHEMTEVHSFRTEVRCNWKLWLDSFSEVFHSPFLHGRSYDEDKIAGERGHRDVALLDSGFVKLGRHIQMTMGGGTNANAMAAPSASDESASPNPLCRTLRSDSMGPWDLPFAAMPNPPKFLNPLRQEYFICDANQVFPNFIVETQGRRNWYFTYHFWPLTVDTLRFELNIYFKPPRNAADRLAQQMTVISFKEIALEDANTLEATQRMLSSRAKTQFPLSDQEVMLRHVHNLARQYVDDYQQGVEPVRVGNAGGHGA